MWIELTQVIPGTARRESSSQCTLVNVDLIERVVPLSKGTSLLPAGGAAIVITESGFQIEVAGTYEQVKDKINESR